jgi:hypothetical protein
MPISTVSHRGRVVDPAGNPLSGIYVYTTGFTPFIRLGVSGPDGSFTVACNDGSLILWGQGPEIPAPAWAADQPWAPRILGTHAGEEPVPCTTADVAPFEVVMQPGVTVTGVIHGLDGEPQAIGPYESSYMVTAFRIGITGMAVRPWTDDPGGRYWLYGLAPGSIHVSDNGSDTVTIEAEPGETVYVDWGPDPDDPSSGINPIVPGTPP